MKDPEPHFLWDQGTVDGCCEVRGKARQRDEQMDGWMDGWMGGWMDGWVDGWMEAERWILRYFSFVISQNKTREENMRREAYAKQWGYILTSMVRALVN